MSNPLSASETSPPTQLVRSSEAQSTSNHVSRATPPAEPKAITPSSLAQRNGADAIPEKIAHSLESGEQPLRAPGANGHFYDRDDGNSDPNTPRLPPTKFGNSDLDSVSQDVLASDFLDQPSTKPSSSRKMANGHEKSIFAASARTLSSSATGPGPQTLDAGTGSSHRFSESSRGSEKSDIQSWLEASSQASAVSLNNTPASFPNYLRTNPQRIPGHTRLPELLDQEMEHSENGTSREHAIIAREGAFSEEKSNRSSSRSNQRRVEKRIEAKMADVEPSLHARSRKSSHILGLFKENTNHDIKKGHERLRNASEHAIDDVSTASSPRGDGIILPRQRGAFAMGESQIKDRLSSTANEPFGIPSEQDNAATQPKGCAQSFEKAPSASSSSRPNASEAKDSRSDTKILASDFRLPVVEGSEEAVEMSKHNMPSRLLEEIRNFHNLAAPFHDKFRSSQAKTTGPKFDAKDKTHAQQAQESVLTNQRGYDGTHVAKTAAGLENEEEEAEHISSALYYPHQAPSPDALEDVSIADARNRQDDQEDLVSQLPDSALPAVAANEKPDEVNIALQVHNKNSYLNGDLHKARLPSAEPESKQHIDSGFSSTSESDYESLDETVPPTIYEDSSLTDDAEATPRASPNTRKSYLLSRSRKIRRGPSAPLGAVELKPYNHQVGGHTTVFRFSKRAVCKQLSNRENEFYEVVERQHPELLKFLPRYALSSTLHGQVAVLPKINP